MRLTPSAVFFCIENYSISELFKLGMVAWNNRKEIELDHTQKFQLCSGQKVKYGKLNSIRFSWLWFRVLKVRYTDVQCDIAARDKNARGNHSCELSTSSQLSRFLIYGPADTTGCLGVGSGCLSRCLSRDSSSHHFNFHAVASKKLAANARFPLSREERHLYCSTFPEHDSEGGCNWVDHYEPTPALQLFAALHVNAWLKLTDGVLALY